MNKKMKHGGLWTAIFTVVSLAWIFPIILVVINSFKAKAYISSETFSLPTGKMFVGLENYARGIDRTDLIASFGWTVVVTVGAVALILLCTSMCAWWIVRVNNAFAKTIYLLFLFNMIVMSKVFNCILVDDIDSVIIHIGSSTNTNSICCCNCDFVS